jgi:arabinofuranosyltransferase
MAVDQPGQEHTDDTGGASVSGLNRFLNRYQWPVFCGVVVLAVFLAWLRRFVCDDAFISFNYARSLIEGNGLTWFGNRVEGYSNFLWVLWSALGIRLGIEPVLWSWLSGIACFVVTLYATWRIGLKLFSEPAPALLGVLFLCTNYTVSSFATSGLETMLQTALLSLGVLSLVRIAEDERLRHLLSLSVVSGLAVLTRMDSFLPVAVIGTWAVFRLVRQRAGVWQYAALVLPGLCLVLPWLVWKQLYYGSILPNSLLVKVGLEPAAFRVGLDYLVRFFNWYLIWPVLVLGIAALVWRRRRVVPGLWLLVTMTLVWYGYVVLVGGDFIEFRFLVPVTPALFLLTAFLVWYGLGSVLKRNRLALPALSLAILFAASVVHAHRFRHTTQDLTMDSVSTLAGFYDINPGHDWCCIGRKLGSDLKGTGAVLALGAVGSIPFYSRLQTVDMLGLNERGAGRLFPARAYVRPRPGHRLRAGLDYLRQRGVNFVIANPTPIRLGALNQPGNVAQLACWVMGCVDLTAETVDGPRLVVMPFSDHAGLLMWCLSSTPRIDSAIARNGWESRQLAVLLSPERVSTPN